MGKNLAALIIGLKKSKGDTGSDDEDSGEADKSGGHDYSEGLKAAMEDLLAAVEAKDADKMAEAFQNAHATCGDE